MGGGPGVGAAGVGIGGAGVGLPGVGTTGAVQFAAQADSEGKAPTGERTHWKCPEEGSFLQSHMFDAGIGARHASRVSMTPLAQTKYFCVTAADGPTIMISPERVTCTSVPSIIVIFCAGLRAVLRMSPNAK